MATGPTLPLHDYSYFHGDKLPQLPLAPGQRVWVCKSKGRKGLHHELFLWGHIVEDVDDGRFQVRYPKGSTYNVKASHLMPVHEDLHRAILVWPETDLYRRSCQVQTLPKESFLEIGCAAGMTCERLDCARVVGIDKSELCIRQAKEKELGHVEFYEWDVFEEEPPVELESFAPQIVAMDINGTRELPAVLNCLQVIGRLWKPRLIVVKSRSLYAHLLTCKP